MVLPAHIDYTLKLLQFYILAVFIVTKTDQHQTDVCKSIDYDLRVIEYENRFAQQTKALSGNIFRRIRKNDYIFDIQKEVILFKSLEIMPIWLINIPALYGSTDQQQYNQEQKWRQKHQYERQANNSKNSRYDQGKSCNHSSQPGTKEEKEGITSYHSTNVSKETFLNNIHQTVESLSHLSYPTVKPHNNIPQTNYYQNISSYYKPVNEESKISQALNGHEVHSDCYVNMDGRQEIPCILNPYPLYKIIKKFPYVDVYKFYHNSYKNLFQPLSEKQNTVKMILYYETGQYAYLPCHTLGAKDSETTIWEKGQNPLFVSTVSFTQDSRFRLNISDEQKLISQPYNYYTKMGVSENVINNPVKKEKLPLQHNYFQSYNLGSKWKHSRWDLIIDFLRPTDSDTYTCMLMGRTSQMIRYHVVVNDSVPRINYSRKKLISISSPQSIVIGSSFNLTCSVRVTKDQSVSIAIDWFRPTYSFQSPSSRHITLINAYKLGNVLSKKSELQSYTTTNPNVTAVVSQLAHSFQQVTSRTSMGVTIYKQVTGESNHYYRSEVLLTVQSSSENDGGLYECRVYEAANYGQEHIVDRAFLDLIIRKRYPHNSFEQSELNEKLRNLLSVFWKLNPSTQNDKLHDQYAQNDVATRVKARYTAQDKNQRADHIFQSLNNDNKIKFSLLESQNPRMRIRTIGNSMSHLFFYRILLDIPVILNILLAVN